MKKTIDNANKVRGFTLVELMIVVAIVGILAAIGYPVYGQYVLKAGRSEGAAALLELMERQENYYRDALSYTADLADLGYSGAVESDTGRYQITAAECDGAGIKRCVLLTATPTPGGRQAADTTGALTLNSRGARSDNWPN